jgi:hypothetical protein
MPDLINEQPQFYIQKFFKDIDQAEHTRSYEIEKIKSNYCKGYMYNKFYPFGVSNNDNEINYEGKPEKKPKSDFWDQ